MSPLFAPLKISIAPSIHISKNKPIITKYIGHIHHDIIDVFEVFDGSVIW